MKLESQIRYLIGRLSDTLKKHYSPKCKLCKKRTVLYYEEIKHNPYYDHTTNYRCVNPNCPLYNEDNESTFVVSIEYKEDEWYK